MKQSMTDFYEPKNPFDQQKFKGLEFSFEYIASGNFHLAAITTQGQLYMWGDSGDGCLGRPPPEINPKQAALLPNEVDFFNDKKVISAFLFFIS
jgi:alpha-tubulin suppressor-like RCC1 family protein